MITNIKEYSMASHIYPIPEVHRSVTRPITMDIIREVLEMTGLKPDQFKTKMLGYSDAQPVPGSTLDDHDDKTPNRLSSQETLVLEIKEEDVGDNVTPVRYPDLAPIFHDKGLKIMMKPVMSLSKATVSVVITVPSRVRAHNWLMEIKRRVYQTQMTNYHTVDYHYPIPKPYVYYLMKMHEMRESVEPLGENFGEWMKRCFVNRWTVISNIEGHERLLAIQERQTNIYGWFDFDFTPEKPEKNSDNAGGWQIQFDYIFHYQRPDSIVFAYPLVIHNQLLPVEMIDTDIKDHRGTYDGYQGLTGTAYDNLVFSGNRRGMFEPPGIPEPIFDDWFPGREPFEHLQLARTLVTIDPAEKRWVVNIDDFSSSFDFKPAILRFMKDVTNRMLIPYKSVFHIQFYKWDALIGHPDITLDKNLKLSTSFDMPLTDMYHVVVQVLANPLLLDEDGWNDIKQNCDVFHEWFEGLFGDTYRKKIRCNIDNTVNEEDLDKVIKDLIDEYGPGGGGGGGTVTGGGKGDGSNGIYHGLPKTSEKYVGGYTILSKRFIKEKQ